MISNPEFVGCYLEITHRKIAKSQLLGDFNDFQFSKTLQILKGNLLFNAMESMLPSDQYSVNFEGNLELFDQIFVSRDLLSLSPEADIVHTNSEFANRISYHDPVLIRISFSS